MSADIMRGVTARGATAVSERFGMFGRGDKVLAAFSGGADSASLLTFLDAAREKLGITVSAYHVNHGIRGEEADRDEDFCRDFCRERGIEFASGRADVPNFAREHGMSEELAARECRYALLVSRAREIGADSIALAHNADDNAETILINLARGSGTRGVCGIPPVGERGGVKLVRPLIRVPKADILAFCAENNIPYVTDSTNNTDSYTRNRIRHRVIPELTALYPGFLDAAARLGDIMRAEDEYLGGVALAAYERVKRGGGISVAETNALPPPVRARALRLFLAASGASDASAYTSAAESVLASREPSASCALTNGLELRRSYDEAVIVPSERAESASAPETVELRPGESAVFAGLWKITLKKSARPRIFNDSVNTFFIPCDKIPDSLSFRTRREGDYFRIPGGTKPVRRLMIDKKLPKRDRGTLPLLALGDEIVCGPGLGLSRAYYAAEDCGELYELRFERICQNQ